MAYQPPSHPVEVLQKIEIEEGLEPDDPRCVETQAARGRQKTFNRLAIKLGLSLSDSRLCAPKQQHVLFFGHRGSGKSTELRRYARDLHGPGRFFVVRVDINDVLDRHNLRYADILMAIARLLIQHLRDAEVTLSADALHPLESWFAEKVLTHEEIKDFSLLVETSAKAKGGIPYLLEMFGGFTSAFKRNSTYKNSLREIIRNTFGDFVLAFNHLLRDAERALTAGNLAQRVLFIIDNTDKLSGEDSARLFIADAEQLLAIEALVVWAAPINMKYETTFAGKLDADLVLPMIKLYEKDGAIWSAGWEALRDILLRRAAPSLFLSDAEVERLIDHCGGHPRELLRLLKLCCEFAEGSYFDANTVDLAIKQLASEYRRFLKPEDYTLLAKIDGDDIHAGNDERTKILLYNLALLEYNDGSWRRSHPVVRTLEGYQRARSILQSAAAGS
jgi:energy-coupling factor transporter ATP-binding protein EcfA2